METSDPPPAVIHSISSSNSSASPILLDTVFLLFLRLVYFLLSRRFLLSTLNPTLRDLSKPETLLPPTVTTSQTPSHHYSHGAAATTNRFERSPSLSANDFEIDLDTEDDGLLSGSLSPNPSYPPTPTRPTTSLPIAGSSTNLGTAPHRAPYRNDGLYSPTSERAGPILDLSPQPENGIELSNLSQKLKDAGRKVKVLQLSHAKTSGPDAVGTKKIKKATKGLNRMSRVLFSLCVAEGCNVLTLVMFHALGILHSRSRHINFSISLHILLAMILLIVPLVQCLLFTYRARGSSSSTVTTTRGSTLSLTTRLLISLIPFSLYIFLFTRIPPYITALPTVTIGPMPLDEAIIKEGLESAVEGEVPPVSSWTEGPEGWEGGGWLAPSLGRVVVLGVVVLGALSGFGAVRTAWNFLDHMTSGSKGVLSDHDILQAERSLYRVRHDLVAKREEYNRLTASERESNGWMGRVFGSKADQEAASLQAELNGLVAMERQVARSISAMKLRKKRQKFGQTLQGKLYNVVGYIFAIYCGARVLMALPSLFYTPTPPDEVQPESHGHGNTNGDWISFLLALGLAHLPTGTLDIDVGVWSRGISLLLTGLLILSSLAQVLRSLSRLLKLTSKTVGAGFLLLSLGQLFSTYVISLLVQLRTTLPPSPPTDTDPFSPFYSNSSMPTVDHAALALNGTMTSTLDGDDSLLSSLPDFRVFGRLFDVVFLLAATGTALYRYIASKVNSADDSGDIYRA